MNGCHSAWFARRRNRIRPIGLLHFFGRRRRLRFRPAPLRESSCKEKAITCFPRQEPSYRRVGIDRTEAVDLSQSSAQGLGYTSIKSPLAVGRRNKQDKRARCRRDCVAIHPTTSGFFHRLHRIVAPCPGWRAFCSSLRPWAVRSLLQPNLPSCSGMPKHYRMPGSQSTRVSYALVCRSHQAPAGNAGAAEPGTAGV